MTFSVQTHRFTVEDFHRMETAGILKEDDRVELIDGELIEMTPIGPAHSACVNRLTRILVQRAGDRALVSVQNAVVMRPRSEFYPDVAVLRPRADDYAAELPGPQDVLLLIEVADTALRFDREIKLPRYAEVGIPEVWIVNLSDASIEVYRDPAPTGYRSTTAFRRGDQLKPGLLPALNIAVSEILPP